jgi:LacI family transcriptional regulator
MATSEDVARLAGVSRATVSRILNGSAKVSDDLRRRVQGAVVTLGYEPDPAARTLVGRRSRQIVIGFFTNYAWSLAGLAQPQYYFYLNVLSDIERIASAAGYDLLLPSHPRDRGVSSYVRSLRARRVAGVIVAGCSLDDPRIPALVEAEIPTVFVDVRGSGPKATYVASDNRAGAGATVEHLVALGHERVAVVAGPDIDLAGRDRLGGTMDALGRAGLPADPALVVRRGWSTQAGYEAARSLLDQGLDFTAVVAHSDMLALGVLHALDERGIRVPEDVSVTGFDDIDLACYMRPPLTTVRQDVEAIAKATLNALFRLMEGPAGKVAPIFVPTELVVRSSTTPARQDRRRPPWRRAAVAVRQAKRAQVAERALG